MCVCMGQYMYINAYICIFIFIHTCINVLYLFIYICGALTDGALTDGALTDGALTDGALTGLYHIYNRAFLHLRSIDWARVFQSLVDVDDLVQAFTDIVISVLRNCSPCTRRSRNRSVPLPKYILKLIALKRKAWKSVCNNGDKEPYKLA